MSVPAGGHLSDEELLNLAPTGPPGQIVTGAADKLPDVGGKCCIQTLLTCSKFVLQRYCSGHPFRNLIILTISEFQCIIQFVDRKVTSHELVA